MDETESAHGTLSPVDRKYTGRRLIATVAITLLTALIVIFVAASLKHMNFGWHPFAHESRYVTESSTF